MSEINVQNTIRNSLAGAVRCWRAFVGTGYQGKRVEYLPDGSPVPPGFVLLKNARMSKSLFPGFSDLFGIKEHVVTPEDVGRKLAVFYALEVKTQTGKPSKEQLAFVEMVRSAGGLAGVVRSPEDARRVLELGE